MQFNIGIDIGASTARMAVKGRGIVYRQSSAIAVGEGRTEPIAFGNAALQYEGRAPRAVTVAYPSRGGLVVRDDLMAAYMKYLMNTAMETGLVRSPQVLLAVDGGAQPSWNQRLLNLALDAGASSASVIRSDMMSALGAGFNITRPESIFVLDIGASKIAATLIAGGRVVKEETLPFGMRRVDETIRRAIRLRYGFIIGDQMSEELKIGLCSAISGREVPPMVVTGLKSQTGFPDSLAIEAEEIYDAASILISSICELAAVVAIGAPPEIAADLNERGIALTGGGAQLYGIDKLVAEKIGLPCRVMDDPGNASARGLSLVLDNAAAFQDMIDAPIRRIERRIAMATNRPS